MSQTVVILTEGPLAVPDAEHIASLHTGADVAYLVLVPADTERNLVTSIIDHLSLLELREAWQQIVGGEPEPEEARAEAAEAVEVSIALLREQGSTATGAVVEDDPLPALRRVVGSNAASEVIVVTRPHAVEDTFHTDWASRAREDLGVPVLHFYTGTSLLG